MQSSLLADEPVTKKRRTDDGGWQPSAVRQQTVDHCIVRDNARAQYGDQHHNYNGPVYQNAPSAMPSFAGAPEYRVTYALKFDGMDMRRATIKLAHGNTCQWLFDSAEYRQWRDDTLMEEHHGFLWIRGKPGAGKSTLMKLAVRHADHEFKDNLRISFFFNAKGPLLERSIEGMYRSLLYRLLIQCPGLEVNLNQRPWTQSTWPVELLEECLRDSVLQLGTRRLICHIDALDECEESEVRRLVEFFEDLGSMAVSAGVSLHTCFASRHYPNVSISKCVHLILDELEGHQEDIEAYVRNNLKVSGSATRLEFARKIRKRAQDVFLWVVLVVRLLNKEDDRGISHNLQAQLDAIPDSLHDLFEDAILKRGSDDNQHLMPTLLLVMFSTFPLTPLELYHCVLYANGGTAETAVVLDHLSQSRIERFILNSSKGLVHVREDRTQFIHETVREYLQNGGLGRLESSICNNPIGVSNDILKTYCVNYASRAARILQQLGHSLDAESPSFITQEKVQTMFPFLAYAISALVTHAELAQAHGVSQVSFVEAFPLDLVIALSDFLYYEEFGIPECFLSATRIYVLALSNAPKLLRLVLSKDEGGSERRSRTNKVTGMTTHERSVLNSDQGQRDTPLRAAIITNCFDSVNLLLEHGADVNAGEDSILASNINYWSESCLDIFNILLQHGADVNALADWEGEKIPVLQLAVMYAGLVKVRLLVEHGADVNAKNYEGRTALQVARGWGFRDIVDYLLDHGAYDDDDDDDDEADNDE